MYMYIPEPVSVIGMEKVPAHSRYITRVFRSPGKYAFTTRFSISLFTTHFSITLTS
jgi:hypothetical protein